MNVYVNVYVHVHVHVYVDKNNRKTYFVPKKQLYVIEYNTCNNYTL